MIATNDKVTFRPRTFGHISTSPSSAGPGVRRMQTQYAQTFHDEDEPDELRAFNPELVCYESASFIKQPSSGKWYKSTGIKLSEP